MGFAKAAEGDVAARALEQTRRQLAPELWNRIDDKLVFPPLERPEVERIAALLLDGSSARLQAERNISYRAGGEWWRR